MPGAFVCGDYRNIDITVRGGSIHGGGVFGGCVDPLGTFRFEDIDAVTYGHAFSFETPSTPGTGADRPPSGVTMILRNNIIHAWPGQPLRTIEMFTTPPAAITSRVTTMTCWSTTIRVSRATTSRRTSTCRRRRICTAASPLAMTQRRDRKWPVLPVTHVAAARHDSALDPDRPQRQSRFQALKSPSRGPQARTMWESPEYRLERCQGASCTDFTQLANPHCHRLFRHRPYGRHDLPLPGPGRRCGWEPLGVLKHCEWDDAGFESDAAIQCRDLQRRRRLYEPWHHSHARW